MAIRSASLAKRLHGAVLKLYTLCVEYLHLLSLKTIRLVEQHNGKVDSARWGGHQDDTPTSRRTANEAAKKHGEPVRIHDDQ
ncbi:hypothetical protein N7449_012244 [Penicillium cf. viridicatum]|uniref:Uncharacterized protein n=1 Tax=Penicillium cf. viridicatum TaxID=2972119 RepID=A0A9W9IQJ6_9EURO|nr:hypothetical protein N7449_012244 [Penicillium cf. viridicatum]